jgi:hypothetical protein
MKRKTKKDQTRVPPVSNWGEKKKTYKKQTKEYPLTHNPWYIGGVIFFQQHPF